MMLMRSDPIEHELLSKLKERFREIAGEDGSIDRAEFQSALSLKNAYIADRVFSIVDEDGSGEIRLEEFLTFVDTSQNSDEETRLRFALRLHDPDDSGDIDYKELEQFIRASAEQHNLTLPDSGIEGLSRALFAHADTDGNGVINYDEFLAVLNEYPALKGQMSFGAAAWLLPPRAAAPTGLGFGNRLRALGQTISNNRAATVFLVLYVLANLALFYFAVQKHAALGDNIYIQIARGCGACLNFNGALILIPMLRHVLTYIRKSTIGGLLPVDEATEFHKLVGNVMVPLALVHTAAHLMNYGVLPESVGFYLFQTSAGLTGVLLLTVFMVMWVCAQDFIRRGGHFELFYLTHLCFVIWFALALMHGPNFWQWVALPFLGYLVERVIRARRMKTSMPVTEMKPLPSGVTRLEMQVPKAFKYRAGDYVFVRLPAISKHEWHPFTVTTAPEEEGKLSVHVRALGNWTRRLGELAKERLAEKEPAPVNAFIDGPYGTPSTHIFESRVAVLIGAGIGVTPFAAILKSILMNREAGKEMQKLEHVHFFWINRDQHSFEWFSELLVNLEKQDADGTFLDIGVWMTDVKLDMTSAFLNASMDVYQKETGRDLFTGLRNRTNLDLPNWNAVFSDIAKKHAGNQVDVYYCGPPGLADLLSREASKHGFTFRKERF